MRIVLIVPYRLTVCAQAWLQCMLAGIIDLILSSSQTGGRAYRGGGPVLPAGNFEEQHRGFSA